MIASSGSKAEDKAKAIAVQAIINDLHFWYHIKRYVILHVLPMSPEVQIFSEGLAAILSHLQLQLMSLKSLTHSSIMS
jgi:hypothetical protein